MIELKKPRILIIAYYFPPGEEIGGRRPFRFYKYLQRMGYECHVVTASQPAGPPPPGVEWVADPLASVWDGKSDMTRSVSGTIELLLRKFLFPGHIGLAWSREVAVRCRQIILAHPQDQFVLFSTFPPLGVLFAGLWVSRQNMIPWISDFRDPVTVDGNAFIRGGHRYWDSLVERRAFRAADFIIANTQTAAGMLAARYPWAGSKLRVIWNGFDPEARSRAHPLPNRKHRAIVHAGALYGGRNPSLVIESMSRLRRAGSDQAEKTSIVLVGSIDFGKYGLERETYLQGEREGWLKLVPPVTNAEAQRITEEADGLLLIQPQTKVQVPGKLYEYICVGRPILALVPPQSAVEAILSHAGVPYVCIYTDDNPDAVDQKFLRFLGLPPTPVRYSEWFETNFNAYLQTQQLAAIIEALAAGDRNPRTNLFAESPSATDPVMEVTSNQTP